MHIKSITIDGFKSYAQKTEVKGFDPFFNAITGLNGSGKSNILDSICFLLGITNLSQVRASNLQDLVYKNGQAGISKATVSITFDNKDKKQSPIGMEGHNEITITRQIVIGGRNKYLINGVNAQNLRVADLFRSVGLNVNNPHFLIMQGRVTKVMNMKPPEILSMIEEATGTSMYESKKESAQRMIEKKENRLAQINRTLDEELTPQLQQLREERSLYLEYQKVQREMDCLKRLLIAHKFMTLSQLADSAHGKLDQMQKEKEKFQEKILNEQNKFDELNQDIKKSEAILDQESGSKLQQLEHCVGEVQKSEAKAQSLVTNQTEQLSGVKKKLKELKSSRDECNSTLQKKRGLHGKEKKVMEEVEEENAKATKMHSIAQKRMQAVQAGLAIADDGEEASWKAQLLQVVNNISQLQSFIKQTKLKLQHTVTELKTKNKTLKESDTSFDKEKRQCQKAEQELEKLKQDLNKLNYTENHLEELTTKKRQIVQDVANMQSEIRRLYTKFPVLQFDYKDPERNWDRRRVKGLVAELLDVPDLKHATALEVVAGGRLFNVVVDTEETGAKLLKHGELKKRCTIIPLNKIIPHSLNNKVVTAAKSLVGADNVDVATSLVGSEDDIEKALEYVFGSALVCRSMDDANKVAFDRNVRAKTVTLGGEVYDPAGTLTGGFRNQSDCLLVELSRSKTAFRQVEQAEIELRKIEQQLLRVSRDADKFNELTSQINLKAHEISNLKSRLSKTAHQILADEIVEMEKFKVEHEQLLLTSQEEMVALKSKSKELERKIADAPAEQERELKEAEKELKRVSTLLEKSRHKFESAKEKVNTLELEIAELEEEFGDYATKEKEIVKEIEENEEKLKQLKQSLGEASAKVAEAKSELKMQRKHVQDTSAGIQRLMRSRKLAEEEMKQAEEKIVEIDSSISKMKTDNQDCEKTIAQMLSEYEWIASDRRLFGQPSSPYDFVQHPPKEINRRFTKSKETLENLQNSVNMRAMSLLGKAEEQYNELLKKKRTVENDKAKIQRTIETLDKMKNQAVTEAYIEVNKNFASIFSTLLPGATAKLSPLEGMSVLAGLEFRVGFGDVWKTNLNELSGGQRSLVALSLILALLLLKPAPIYILDEVDAALDLSHTQNIGRMLKNHFRHSQFLVVSLKDGMFNNANVLFRTKFVDGVSTVTHYTQTPDK